MVSNVVIIVTQLSFDNPLWVPTMIHGSLHDLIVRDFYSQNWNGVPMKNGIRYFSSYQLFYISAWYLLKNYTYGTELWFYEKKKLLSTWFKFLRNVGEDWKKICWIIRSTGWTTMKIQQPMNEKRQLDQLPVSFIQCELKKNGTHLLENKLDQFSNENWKWNHHRVWVLKERTYRKLRKRHMIIEKQPSATGFEIPVKSACTQKLRPCSS